jgi:hypothetical protein
MPESPDLAYLDYFMGGVPPGPLFWVNLIDIEGVLRSTHVPPHGLDPAAELCFIGLVAYFEAFFRYHVASLLTVCPQLVRKLRASGRDVSIDGTVLLEFDDHPRAHLGFILAERYEVGTARSVNSLYKDLLLITPFSKDEASTFEKILNDRNLLVHHGGIYTSRYAGQTFVRRRARHRVFFNSLVIRRAHVRSTAAFFTGIAKKTLAASHGALEKYIAENRIRTSAVQRKAIAELKSWGSSGTV